MQLPSDGVRADEMQGARIGRILPRIAADFADAAFLGVLGLIVGLSIGERVAPAGTPARLLGLLIAVPYLAVFGSRLAGGQTFGKTLLNLRVVDGTGQPLSVARSTARAVMVTTPWMFSGLRFRAFGIAAATALWVGTVLAFGLAVASLGTFLFSPRTRQTIHDLLVGSYVVEGADLGRRVTVRTQLATVATAAIWIAIVAGYATVQVGRAWRAKPGPASEPLLSQLAAVPHVSSFNIGTTTVRQMVGRGTGNSQQFLNVVFWYDGPDDGVSQAKQAVASAVLWHHPGVGTVPEMQITVIRGWDLGVASWTNSASEIRSIDEWRATAE